MNNHRDLVFLFITVFLVPRTVVCIEEATNAYYLNEVTSILNNSISQKNNESLLK